jgi:ABC-type amino acid transport substrate-binding protein
LTLTRTVAVAVLLMACGRVPQDDALGRLRARGTLRWGGDLQGGEPYVFQDPEDASRLVGFEVEIADGLRAASACVPSSCRTTGRRSSRRSSATISTSR